MLGKYDDILADIKQEHTICMKYIKKFVGFAKVKVPLLCEALRDEADENNIKPSNEDIRDRVMKDCLQYWEKKTILDALPDWMIREKEDPMVVTVEGNQEGITTTIGIPKEEDEKKFKSERIQNITLDIKRNFRLLMQEADNKDSIQELYNDYVYANHALNNVKEAILDLGRKHKATLYNPIEIKEKTMRKPISVYDINFTTTEDKKTMIDEITENVTLIIKQLDDFLNGLHRYPILTLEEYDLMRRSSKSFLIEVFNYVNNKSSQGIYDQIETDLLSEETTEPQAARNTKTLTLVCKSCIKKFDPEHNDEPPIMNIDQSSPSGFRCPTCLGMEMCERNLTKDIIAQRKEFLQKVSEQFEAAPSMKFLQIYSKMIKERVTSTRKTLMSKLLKNSSFGSSKEDWH